MTELMPMARSPRSLLAAMPDLQSWRPLLIIAPVVAAVIAISALTSALLGLTLAIAGFGCAAACVRRPGLAVLALAALLPFNDLAVQLLGPGTPSAVAVGAAKDVLLVAIVVALVNRRSAGRVAVSASLGTFLLLLLGIGAAAGLMTGDGLQALYGWRNDFEPLLLLAAVPLVVNRTDARHVLTAIVVAGEVTATIAIATHQVGISWLLGLKFDQPPGAQPIPSSYFSAGSITPRAFSPYVSPNELGVACVLVLTVIVYRRDWSRGRRTALAVLPLIALALTASRSAWLGLAVLVVFEVVRQLRSRQVMPLRLGVLVLSAGGLASALALLVSSGDPSIGGHQASLSQSVNLLLAHPLGLGTGLVGPRATRFASSGVLTESFLLVIALEAGILALLCYAGVIISAGVTLMRRRPAQDSEGTMVFLGVAALLASLPNQFVLPTLQDGAVSWLLWIIVGVSLSYAVRLHRDPLRDRNPFVTVAPAGVD